MKCVSETGRVAYKYRLFGWYVIIANSPMKFRQGNNNHGISYDRLLHARRQMAGCKCERCGRDLSIYGRIYHLRPAGDPERNTIENVRIFCNSCFKAVTRNEAPVFLPESIEKGGEA